MLTENRSSPVISLDSLPVRITHNYLGMRTIDLDGMMVQTRRIMSELCYVHKNSKEIGSQLGSEKVKDKVGLSLYCLSLIRVIVPVFSIVIFLMSIPTLAFSSNYGVFTSDSSPYGSPYQKWVEKWWTWWAGIPNDKHPAKDYSDSERCSVMQEGPVWFIPDVLPGAGNINYRCNVPTGKAILLPITTTSCDKGFDPSATDIKLKECADNILTPINNMIVTVDGERIDVSNLLAKTNFYNITYPTPPVDIWGPIKAGPGTYRAIATGYFLFLHDLSPGEHNIVLHVVDLLKGNEGPPPRFELPRDFAFDVFVK